MPRTAAVTGATGFIGWNIAERLRDAGWTVKAIVRPASPRPVPEGTERIAVPLDREALARALDGAAVIVHSAGLTTAPGQAAFDAVNVRATGEVARAAAKVGARLVSLSSQAAAGPASCVAPRTEADEPSPRSAYGVSKLAGEREVRSCVGLDSVILRPVAVYGPRDRQFLPLFRAGRVGLFPLLTASDYMMLHIDDLVSAVMAAAASTAASGSTLFVGHASVCSSERILRAIAAAVGRTYRPLRVPAPVLSGLAAVGQLAARAGLAAPLDRSRLSELRAGSFVCSVARARDILGFEARIDVEEGFARTAEWYRRQGWLRGR
jgi:nucleoside-diphosphate-sugar epimerase